MSTENLILIQSWLDNINPADLNVRGGRLTWLHQEINNQLGVKIPPGTLKGYFYRKELRWPKDAKEVAALRQAALTPEELGRVQSLINTHRPNNLGVQKGIWDPAAVRHVIIKQQIKRDIPLQLISDYINLGLLSLPEEDAKQAQARKKAALTPQERKLVQSWLEYSTPFKMGVGAQGAIWNHVNLRQAIIKEEINPNITTQVLSKYSTRGLLRFPEDAKEALARRQEALTPQELKRVQSWINDSTPFHQGVGVEGQAWYQANLHKAIKKWINSNIVRSTVSTYLMEGKLRLPEGTKARRRAALTPDQIEEVQTWIYALGPADFGLEGKNWNQAKLCEAIIEVLEVEMKHQTLSDYFKKKRLIWKEAAGQPTGGGKRDLTSGLLASMEESAGPSQASVLRSQEPAPNPAKKPRL